MNDKHPRPDDFTKWRIERVSLKFDKPNNLTMTFLEAEAEIKDAIKDGYTTGTRGSLHWAWANYLPIIVDSCEYYHIPTMDEREQAVLLRPTPVKDESGFDL